MIISTNMVNIRGNKWREVFSSMIKALSLLSIVTSLVLCITNCSAVENSQVGRGRAYIVYCPCMGRFGNQAEQLLGSLLFAKSLNRTLVLPPFIHYALNQPPELVPFDQVIQVEPIKEYHDVILLKDFMSQIAPSVWPEGKRKFYCYSERTPRIGHLLCDPLRGQPFYTFWSAINVEEDKSVVYEPLMTSPRYATEWNRRFPPTTDPVLAFVGAPSSFPTPKDSIAIQKFIKLSEFYEQKAKEYKRRLNFYDKPYLSMHIRHGSDWTKACEIIQHSDGVTQLFSSNQCTGYGLRPHKKIQIETCLPSSDSISQKLTEGLQLFKSERNIDIKIVYIATDSDDAWLWEKLRALHPGIRFITSPPAQAENMHSKMIDIYLMAYSDVFIGNCISSFSAFPARIRSEQLNRSKMTLYFGPTFEKFSEKTSSNVEL